MNRRAAIAGLLGLPLVAVADDWNLLFDGPRVQSRCCAGDLERGMRFRPTNDRTEEWLVLDVGIVLVHAPEGESYWNYKAYRPAAELTTGKVRDWEWYEEVIRLR